PQAETCAACPHNVWGSKVTPTGSQVKACSDSKKLAVVLAEDTPIIVNNAAGGAKAFDGIYLLRVPAASMRTWRDYAKEIRGRGIPIIGVVTEVSFEPSAAHPALLFKAAAFGTVEQFNAARSSLDDPRVAEAVGSDDVPFAGGATKALPQEVPDHLRVAPQSLTAPPPAPAVSIAPAPQPAASFPNVAPAPAAVPT